MTTTITLHVNGRYRAEVRQDGREGITEVHGNYEGSPNPDGKAVFNLVHGSIGNKFVISEYYIPTPDEEKAARVAADKRTQSAKLEVRAGKAIGTDAKGNDTKTGKPVDVDAHLKGELQEIGEQDTANLKAEFKD